MWGHWCQAEASSHHQGLASWWYRGCCGLLGSDQGPGSRASCREATGQQGWVGLSACSWTRCLLASLLTGADAPTSRPWSLLFCLLDRSCLILSGPAAAPPPPGSLRNLPGQACGILRQDSPSDDQVALTQPDHIAVLLSLLCWGLWPLSMASTASQQCPLLGGGARL